MISVKRRELTQVDPLHERHLEVCRGCDETADLELGARQQIERAHQIFARELPAESALMPVAFALGGDLRIGRRASDRSG